MTGLDAFKYIILNYKNSLKLQNYHPTIIFGGIFMTSLHVEMKRIGLFWVNVTKSKIFSTGKTIKMFWTKYRCPLIKVLYL